MTMVQPDEYYMRKALEEARQAFREDEVPIGAVVVSPSGAIIGRGHNMTQTLLDVTAHAEMLALTAAERTIGGKYLKDCTIFVTVEPCIMCAGAIGWAQISRVVFGAEDAKRGYSAYTRRSPLHPRAEIIGGVLADECAELMRSFFFRKR